MPGVPKDKSKRKHERVNESVRVQILADANTISQSNPAASLMVTLLAEIADQLRAIEREMYRYRKSYKSHNKTKQTNK
jgi:hypothetical protein